MNRGEVHQISMKLGQLSTAVEMMTDLWKTQEVAATAGRKALHEKVEMIRQELGLQVAGLSLRVDRLADQVKTIEPTIGTLKDANREYEDDQMRAEGAKNFKKWLIGGMTGVAGTIGWAAHEFIGYLKH